MLKQKYIKTEDKKIVVFPELFQHSEFRNLKPISAGFISIGAKGKGEPSCTCYGESVSLGLKSDPEDTDLATRQILGGY